MEPEGSLPHSQVPATSRYSEPDRSSPHSHIPLPEDTFYSYPSIYAWVSQVVFFLQVSPSKSCILLSSPPIRATCPAYLILLDFITRTILGEANNIGWRVQIIKLLSMLFSPLPCHLVPLKPKYSPQHPILKHPHPAFLRQCERPSFTPIQNNNHYQISASKLVTVLSS